MQTLEGHLIRVECVEAVLVGTYAIRVASENVPSKKIAMISGDHYHVSFEVADQIAAHILGVDIPSQPGEEDASVSTT